jgi:predicted transcriptional regulator
VIQDVVERLPEEVDVDALIERLHLLDKIEAGEQQLKRGEGISHEAAKERLASWLR